MTPKIHSGLLCVGVGAAASLLGRIGFWLFPPTSQPTVTGVTSGFFFFTGIIVIAVGLVIGLIGLIERDAKK